MKDDLTRIAIVLDRSGSMEVAREATVSGFNRFIRDQRNLAGECKVKLVQFDDIYEEVFDLPLKDVPELTQAVFIPRGKTALFDAQGRTILALGAELAAMAEPDRPGKVMVVTITDGLENASSEFDAKRVADMIATQRGIYKWDFVFLGANQDAVKIASSMNIPMHSAMTYNASRGGVANTMDAVSNYVRSYRISGQATFSAEERSRAMADDD